MNAGVRSYARSDDMARALTFTVLVLTNLCLIHANHSWGRSAWRGGDTSNRQFGWIALATVILLGLVLGVPAISRLFYFIPPSPIMLFAGLSATLLCAELPMALRRDSLEVAAPSSSTSAPDSPP